MSKKSFALFFASLLLLLQAANAEVVSKVAAVVNDAIITTHQLEKALQESLAANPAAASLGAAEKDKLRRQLLDQMIEELLVEERVKQLRLKVGDEEVEAAVEDIQRQNSLTREQLKSALEQQGMDYEVYRENLRKQILRYKLIGVEIRSKAEVTSAEVREYYREHIDDYREPPFMHLSRLTFPIPARADRGKIDEIRQKAVEARDRLAKGESISTLMIAYATANVEGGDMGKFQVGELSSLFDRAVRDLETGQVSEVVETPNALFMFRMVEKSSGGEKPFEAVSTDIEQLLMQQKQEQAFKDWNRELRKSAYIDIRI